MISWKIILCLRKSLYGVKLCSQIVYDTFMDFVILIGLMALYVHRVMFVLNDKHQGMVIAAVVPDSDDLPIIANAALIG